MKDENTYPHPLTRLLLGSMYSSSSCVVAVAFEATLLQLFELLLLLLLQPAGPATISAPLQQKQVKREKKIIIIINDDDTKVFKRTIMRDDHNKVEKVTKKEKYKKKPRIKSQFK